jgi:hypothetical protein
MHRFIPEPGSPACEPINPEHAAAIRRWTRETLRLAEDAVITVTDTPCRDAGCPLVETMVTVFDQTGTRAWAFTRPAIAVTQMMVRQTLATPPRSAR